MDDRISYLPGDVLRVILYFLPQKEAARTSVLSTAWRNLWIRRKNLEFFESKFKRSKEEFRHVIDDSLRRYHDSAMYLEEFTLSTALDDETLQHLQTFWIPRIEQLGGKKISLIFESQDADMNIPYVLFEIVQLYSLRLEKFTDSHLQGLNLVACVNLRMIALVDVDVTNKDLENIANSCPLLENVTVQHCRMVSRLNFDVLHHLKTLCFENYEFHEQQSFEVYVWNLETAVIGSNICDIFKMGGSLLHMTELSLNHVMEGLRNLSNCYFPCLHFLRITNCHCLSGVDTAVNAPNLVLFEYKGQFVPKIKFAQIINQWDSKIQLLKTSSSGEWLPKLAELLQCLEGSNVYLIMDHNDIRKEHIFERTRASNKQVIESLSVRCDLSVASSLFLSVFLVCKPKILYYIGDDRVTSVAYLWGILKEEGNIKHESLPRILEFQEIRELLLEELEEANFQIKKKWNREKDWHSCPLFEHLMSYKLSHFRFILKWKET
ncbi:hypothetical protein MIMGU_mgv1a020807mg, partial [Erythranthe guttata]